jgi:hypothetical protein
MRLPFLLMRGAGWRLLLFIFTRSRPNRTRRRDSNIFTRVSQPRRTFSGSMEEYEQSGMLADMKSGTTESGSGIRPRNNRSITGASPQIPHAIYIRTLSAGQRSGSITHSQESGRGHAPCVSLSGPVCCRAGANHFHNGSFVICSQPVLGLTSQGILPAQIAKSGVVGICSMDNSTEPESDRGDLRICR